MVQSWFKLTRRLRKDWLEGLYHGPQDPKLVRDRARFAVSVKQLADERIEGQSAPFSKLSVAAGLLYRIRIYLQVWLSLRRDASPGETQAALDMLSGLNEDRIQFQALLVEAVSSRSHAPEDWKAAMRRRGHASVPWRAAVSLMEAGRYAVDLHWVTSYRIDMALRDSAEPHGGLAILTRGLGSPDRMERTAAAAEMNNWLSGEEVRVEDRSIAEHFLIQVKRARRLNFHAGRIDAQPGTLDKAMAVARERAPELAKAYFKRRIGIEGDIVWHDRFAKTSYADGVGVRPGPAMQSVREALLRIHPKIDKSVNAIVSGGGLFHPKGEGGGFTTPVIYNRRGSHDAGPFVYAPFNGGGLGLRTLAHEMGHAVHAQMSAGLGPLLSDAGWAVSETMAFTSERLTSQTHPEALADQDFGMLVHQPAIAWFERDLASKDNASDVDAVWIQAMRAMYGEDIDFSGYAPFWKRHTQTLVSLGYPAAYLLAWALSGQGVKRLAMAGDKTSATYLDYLGSGCRHGFDAFAEALKADDVALMMHDAYDDAIARLEAL